jgi:amino acid transporter
LSTSSKLISFPRFLSLTVTAYLGLPIYAALYFGHKFWHKTRAIKPEEVDLISGRKEFDMDEAAWEEEEAARGKLPWWKKLWEGA